MGPIEPAALSGPIISNSIIVKQCQSLIQPGPTPSVPAETTAFSRTHQMTSDLFLHPVFDISKAFAGVSDPKREAKESAIAISSAKDIPLKIKFYSHDGQSVLPKFAANSAKSEPSTFPSPSKSPLHPMAEKSIWSVCTEPTSSLTVRVTS